MKKISAMFLALLLAVTFSVCVFADPAAEKKTAEITTSISPTYTVAIPASTAVAFNALSTNFDKIEVTAAQIHPNKCIQVELTASGTLKNSLDAAKTIPYAVKAGKDAFAKATYTAAGEKTPLTIDIAQADWNKAYAGSYSDTVSFTISYVDRPAA